MLTVTLDNSHTKLNIVANFAYKDRIKSIPSATFDFEHKVWQIETLWLEELLKEFWGEIYFKTPLWKIRGEEAPDYSKIYEIPDTIKCPTTKISLYPYQKFGARFMIDRINKYGFCINADGVGIGKTAQGIAVMQWFKEHAGAKKFLIIGKKSIKEQWTEEIRKFTDAFNDYEIKYTEDYKPRRLKAYKAIKDAKEGILVASYHNFLNDTAIINEIGFNLVLIDEAHCVKAHKGKLNNNIGTVVRGTPTVFLTGTPIMSNPEDIFGIIQMAKPDYFGSYEDFSERYLVTSWNYGYNAVIGAKNLDELREKVQNIVIRRTNHEVAIQMPDVITRNIFVDASDAQLNAIEIIGLEEEKLKDTYDTMAKKGAMATSEEKEAMFRCMNMLKGLINIKQAAADDPLIFHKAKSNMMKKYQDSLPSNLKKSPKTETLIDLVEEIISAGEKVILFSKFVTVGKYYADVLEKELKINILMYTGEENDEKRIKNKELFLKSPEHQVLIGSDAMAEGLNLQVARHVINIDQPDTYAIYTQRLGRARRVSSEYKNIVVYNLYTKGTADVSKAKKLEKDMALDDALIMADEAQSKALKKASNE